MRHAKQKIGAAVFSATVFTWLTTHLAGPAGGIVAAVVCLSLLLVLTTMLLSGQTTNVNTRLGHVETRTLDTTRSVAGLSSSCERLAIKADDNATRSLEIFEELLKLRRSLRRLDERWVCCTDR